MDFNAASLTNRFEFELVDPFQLDVTYGLLDGVTGGRQTESYRGDYRVTAVIDIDGEAPDRRFLIRVWHVCEQDGQSERTELGTFMQGTPSLKYANGRTVGSIPLYSPMYRLDMDKRPSDTTYYSYSGTIAAIFQSVVKGAGGTPWVHPSLSQTATFSEQLWAGGESVLTMCHACANALGAMVGIDEHGRVTLEKYQNPAMRSDSFAIDPGAAAITKDGVSIKSAEWYNRVTVHYKKDDVDYVGWCNVAEEHPLHFNRVGYWKMDYSTLSDVPDNASEIEAACEAAAKARLAEVSKVANVYTASLLFTPRAKCGEVGTFWYQDSPDHEGLYVRALVTQREIDLDPAMRMRITLEEVS